MHDAFSQCKHAWMIELRKQKGWMEHAFSQVPDEQIHQRCLPGVNPPSVIITHVAGSLQSRFTDFLTTDGEKDWRNREAEFVIGNENREELRTRWEAGWSVAFASIEALTESDVMRAITIRAEPLNVAVAITRAIGHCAYHTGQMMLICRSLAGTDNWQWTTIAPGKSAAFKKAMQEKFGEDSA